MAPWQLAALAPIFRYSYSRDAYILRGVGSKRGPVLRPRSPAPIAPESATERTERFARDETLTGSGKR